LTQSCYVTATILQCFSSPIHRGAQRECKHGARKGLYGLETDCPGRSDGDGSPSLSDGTDRRGAGAFNPRQRAPTVERVGRGDGRQRVQERRAGRGHELRAGRSLVAHRHGSRDRPPTEHGVRRRHRRRRLHHDERPCGQQRKTRAGDPARAARRRRGVRTIVKGGDAPSTRRSSAWRARSISRF
jgi:hypothetical protein